MAAGHHNIQPVVASFAAPTVATPLPPRELPLPRLTGIPVNSASSSRFGVIQSTLRKQPFAEHLEFPPNPANPAPNSTATQDPAPPGPRFRSIQKIIYNFGRFLHLRAFRA